MVYPAIVRLPISTSQLYAHLLGLDPFILGQELVGHGKLRCLSIIAVVVGGRSSYLHGAAQAEDAVVCLLGSEALEGLLDDVVLFGDQVIGPAKQWALAPCPISPDAHRKCNQYFLVRYVASGVAYISPICLYPAALQYQLAIGWTQRRSHGRLAMEEAKDGADMASGVQRSLEVVGGRGCRQLQIVLLVRSSSCVRRKA